MGDCILHRADGTSVKFPFAQGPVKIGRGADVHIRIDDEFISRTHCEVSLREDRVFIKDLDSHNGTIVNGQRVQETNLTTGDKVQLGETHLTFQLDAQMKASANPGEPPRRDINAIFRVPPAAPQQTKPAETVRIALPQTQTQSTPPKT